MPPKLSKKEQEELARQEEEKRRQEEEERQRILEEERKKYEPSVLKTGLKCYLTSYYVTEILNHSKPREFMRNFIKDSFSRLNIWDNFREIDIQFLIEFQLHNVQFGCENSFDEQQIFILINIIQTILMQKDPKYEPFREQQEGESEEDFQAERRKQMLKMEQKSGANDLKLLQDLLYKHSFQGQNQMKVFSANILEKIMKNLQKSYFQHFNLIKFVQCNEQQQQEIYQTIFVDNPQPVSGALEEAVYHALDEAPNQEEEDNNKQQEGGEEQEGEQDGGEEEEEPLDAVSQQILMEKIREAQAQMQQQLQERQESQEAKLVELQTTKGKKK